MNQNQLMSEVDEYGFVRTPEENQFKSSYYVVLTRRSLRWSKAFPERLEAGRRLQRFIRKGEEGFKTYCTTIVTHSIVFRCSIKHETECLDADQRLTKVVGKQAHSLQRCSQIAISSWHRWDHQNRHPKDVSWKHLLQCSQEWILQRSRRLCSSKHIRWILSRSELHCRPHPYSNEGWVVNFLASQASRRGGCFGVSHEDNDRTSTRHSRHQRAG